VLPFTKRPARSDDASDDTASEEREVRASAPSTETTGTGTGMTTEVAASDLETSSVASMPDAEERPRVFNRSAAGDEDMTMLMPRKGMTFAERPPPAVVPEPMPKLISARPPRPMLDEPPTRHFVVPSAMLASSAPPSSSSPSSARPMQLARPDILERPLPPPPETRPSDPKIDPPATVITARTRIVAAPPTISWAAALVAMGVFVGLVTAVVARGDADTLIDAAASFVDPSGARAAAAAPVEGDGAASVTLPTKAQERRTNLLQTVDTLAAEPPPVVALPEPAALPVPPRPAPVAYVAPAPVVHRVARPMPRPPREERATASRQPAPKPALVKAVKADDDVQSATAADALAKAQLEASLR